MLCPNCNSSIDKDSIFCIFCGKKIDRNIIKDKKNTEKGNKKESIVKPKGKEDIHKPKETDKKRSISYEKKNSAANSILITFLVISVFAIAILSIILSENLSKIEDYKNEVKSLSGSIKSLEIENATLSNELNWLKDDYNALKKNYNNLKNRYNNLTTENLIHDEETDYRISYYNTAEVNFLNSVLSILDEFNLAVNHMNTYHNENWIFNDPEEIALEETYLVKLNELLNELKNVSCPNSLTGQKSNLITIFEEVCHYKKLQIGCMKRNDYNGNINNFNSHIVSVDKLFNYYNSLVK